MYALNHYSSVDLQSEEEMYGDQSETFHNRYFYI